ncbi:MAG: ABC transporter transmembrane domain-containing protein [Hyphomonadaceae bacterium]
MSDGSGSEASGGSAGFDRTAGAQRWNTSGGPDRARGKSLRPLLGLMPYVKRQSGTAMLAIFFLLLASALNLAITIPARILGDTDWSASTLSSENADLVNAGFLAIIGIALIWGLTSAVRFYFFSRFGERLAADLRADVYDRLMSLSPAYFSKLRTGEAVSRLTADITLIETFFGSSFSMATRSTVTALGAVIGMAIISWKLMLALFVLAPVTLIPIMMIGRRVRKHSVNAQDRIADAASEATETLDAIDLVQAYGMEADRGLRFRNAIEIAFRAALARISARATLTGLIIALMFTLVTGVLWLGAHAVMAGDMSMGAFIQFVMLAMFGIGGFATVAEVFGDAMRASGAATRAMEIMEQTPDIAAPPSPRPMPADIKGHVALRDVSFSYAGAKGPSLRNVTLEARPGELVALVGPSGAGKSTVFRLLLRFFDPDAGAVTLDGIDAREVDPADWRARFSYVPQEAPIFSGDAASNVRFGRPDASEADVREALERAEAMSFLEARGGLSAEVGAKGRQLSGGERQRIAIARALVRGAPVMLLDEATSALDAANERLVQKALEEAARGRTSFVIAHRLATVRKADRIVVMDQGAVVEQGSHDELVGRGGLYAKLAEMQFAGG